MHEYAYEHFHPRLMLEDQLFLKGPRPGERIPGFTLRTTDGRLLRKQDLLSGRPVLLTFGSITCPMTAAAREPLRRVYREFEDRVDFVTVYVREAHPGDRFPQAATTDQKVAYAQAYQQRDRIPWTVAVDDAQGSFHEQMDPKPNSFYVMAPDGTVAFRALWSDDESTLRKALRAAVTGAPPAQAQRRVVGMLSGLGKMDEMLELSGPTARRDVARQMPPMYAMARVASVFKPLPPMGRGIAAMTTMGLGMFLVARGIRRARASYKSHISKGGPR
jgi:peroxiredoxin